MTRFARLLALVAAASLLLPDLAAANEPQEHDGGFFLRIAPGLGFSRTKIDDQFDSLEFRGLSGVGDLAIGVGIGENLIVHATLFGWTVVDPTVEINNEEFETQDVTLTLYAFGGGVTYYLNSESNIYLTGSLGAAQITLEYDDEFGRVSEDTDTGLAFELGVGKEWWVGDRWGLGVSGVVNFHSVPPVDEATENLSGPSFGARLSLTFN
jgi:hypothetical protein